MVQERRCGVIVMLTRVTESGGFTKVGPGSPAGLRVGALHGYRPCGLCGCSSLPVQSTIRALLRQRLHEEARGRWVLASSSHDSLPAGVAASSALRDPLRTSRKIKGAKKAQLQSCASMADHTDKDQLQVYSAGDGCVILFPGCMQCAQYFPEGLHQRDSYGGWHVQCTSVREIDSDVTRRDLLVTPSSGTGASIRGVCQHASAGACILFCSISCAPPCWLVHKSLLGRYPQVMRVWCFWSPLPSILSLLGGAGVGLKHFREVSASVSGKSDLAARTSLRLPTAQQGWLPVQARPCRWCIFTTMPGQTMEFPPPRSPCATLLARSRAWSNQTPGRRWCTAAQASCSPHACDCAICLATRSRLQSTAIGNRTGQEIPCAGIGDTSAFLHIGILALQCLCSLDYCDKELRSSECQLPFLSSGPQYVHSQRAHMDELRSGCHATEAAVSGTTVQQEAQPSSCSWWRSLN